MEDGFCLPYLACVLTLHKENCLESRQLPRTTSLSRSFHRTERDEALHEMDTGISFQPLLAVFRAVSWACTDYFDARIASLNMKITDSRELLKQTHLG
jgi:hypothetical protein